MRSWKRKQSGADSPPSKHVKSGSSSGSTDSAAVRSFARDFGNKIQHLLNATIANNVVIKTAASPQPGVFVVAHGLTKTSAVGEPFPVCIRGKPRMWMDLSFKFCHDPEREYPTVLSSFVAVFAAEDGLKCLCHFDYEREKANDYPEAHIQVYGESEAIAHWGGDLEDGGLHRLHFPAGHRRFRWTFEDVIEFVIREGIVEARPGWRQLLDVERDKFHRLQLRAAIRRDPTTAIDYLREIGYDVTER
jgi:hypothetical protein